MDWLRGDMLDWMTFLLTESTVEKVTVNSLALARTKGPGYPDTHSRQIGDFQLSCFCKREASSFAFSTVSTPLNAEMAAAPGVSWDLILWRGKREDLRDLTELSGCMRTVLRWGRREDIWKWRRQAWIPTQCGVSFCEEDPVIGPLSSLVLRPCRGL